MNSTVNYWRCTSHWIVRERTICISNPMQKLFKDTIWKINFFICYQFIQPLHWLLRVPSQSMSIDIQSSINGSINKRSYGSIVKYTIRIDARTHFHGITCYNLIEISYAKGIILLLFHEVTSLHSASQLES